MNRLALLWVGSMVSLVGCETTHPSRGAEAAAPPAHEVGATSSPPSVAPVANANVAAIEAPPAGGKIVKSEEEWKKVLTPEQFAVMRRQGTEPAFTGKYWDAHGPATYVCAACGQALFSSDQKFDSGTGWPSYWAPIEGAVETTVDSTHGMERTEVHCSRCGGHLGHLFDDGPKPTGLRYCINSVSIAAQSK